ncbi:hypothetical protein H5410_016179 [Solanum commersonii]|uniref:Thioredoxin domain-containing protein n=1 Tax=Solanum commersonii TaxID=4109 RepID=A0A9J5ZWA2_SOLCO|nr:hypothetical protein H5410_016179 [Solanum commersonii]
MSHLILGYNRIANEHIALYHQSIYTLDRNENEANGDCCSSGSLAHPLMGQCWTKVCSQENNDVPPTFDLAGGNICLVTSMDKWEQKMSEANDSGKIAVVNFSASWCNPCRAAAPGYHELADKYTSMIFLTVDVDELAVSFLCFVLLSFICINSVYSGHSYDTPTMLSKFCTCSANMLEETISSKLVHIGHGLMQELSTSWDIKATPTFIFFRDGRQVDKLVGVKKQELQQKLMNLAESTRSPG